MKQYKIESRKVTSDDNYSYRIVYPSYEFNKSNSYKVEECKDGYDTWKDIPNGEFNTREEAVDFLTKFREERRSIVEYEIFR